VHHLITLDPAPLSLGMLTEMAASSGRTNKHNLT